MRKKKHLVPHPIRDRFDFVMDQVCASSQESFAPFGRFL
jgi:hypothetical protein